MPRHPHVSPHQMRLPFDESPLRRLFIGLLPPATVQAAIDRQRRHWQLPPMAMPTRPQRLHMTMHFLGDVEHSRAVDLQLALAEVGMESTTLALRTPELWGVAVVRPDENGRLRALHARMARSVQRVGLPAHAGWTPHVTIARNTRGAVPPGVIEPVCWPVDDFVLIWSRFEPRAQYDVLARYPVH